MTTEPTPCEWCKGEADETSTCPWSLECPTCRAKPGKRCKRPSGHSGAFVPMHQTRTQAAERLDDERDVPWTRDADKRAEAGLPVLYQTTMDMELPNIGDTCCGKCGPGLCYVDQLTGA